MTKFNLNKAEKEKLKKWLNEIKADYGEVGTCEFKFTPGPIGTKIVVYNDQIRNEKDITDYDSW